MNNLIAIKEIMNLEKGTLQSTKNIQGDYFFITAAEQWKNHNCFTHECEALIFAAGAEGSLGRTHYINDKFIASDLCFILTPKKDYVDKIDLEFYSFFFNSNKDWIVKKLATGTSKKAINQKKFLNLEIPLINVEQQILIKEKINQINKIKRHVTNLDNDLDMLITSLIENKLK